MVVLHSNDAGQPKSLCGKDVRIQVALLLITTFVFLNLLLFEGLSRS